MNDNIVRVISKKDNKVVSQLKAFLPLILLGLIFSVLSGNFLTANNLITTLQQSTNIAIIAYAETMVIITGGIDLSLGSILGVAGVVVGKLILAGVPVWLSVVGGICFGGLLGFVNGFVVSKMKLIPFIATLGMQNIARGIAYVMTNSLPVSGLDQNLYFIGGGSIGGIPVPIFLMFILAVMFAFIMRRTVFGRRVYSIGSNREAARLSGISVEKIEMWVFVIGGFLAGLVGVILASRVLSSQPNAGTGYESDAIAAVFIGGTSPFGGSGTIMGTVIGALTIAVLKNGLNLLQVNAFWQQIAIGVVIIGAVFIDNLRRRK